MSFDTQSGTRGSRQPGGIGGTVFRTINKRANKMMAKRIRRDGKVGESPAAVLTTVGRKSGVERETPVLWFPGEGETRLIVASARGSATNPAWYHNIAANPDKVKIEIDGRQIPVVADQLHGDERARAWEQIIAAAPNYAEYQGKTDRTLPVIRLTPRATE